MKMNGNNLANHIFSTQILRGRRSDKGYPPTPVKDALNIKLAYNHQTFTPFNSQICFDSIIDGFKDWTKVDSFSHKHE